ncbi:MAG TPA: hypothetical protein VI612_00265 [Candidatus Nanoarchaeia archaeon]|nr:hypothetical protein [Candidatus Nanoarchaeia archaeon]
MKQVWVVALLLLPLVFASRSISSSQTDILIEDGSAFVNGNFILAGDEEIGNFTLILSPSPEDVVIIIDGLKVRCLLQAEFARCGNLSKGPHEINFSYETSYPIASVGENTLFRYTDRLPYHTDNQSVTLTLPVGYIIPREKDKDESFYISPKPQDVYSDGQRIILSWEQKGQELPVSVISRKVIGPPLGWIGAAVLSSLITFVIVVWLVLGWRRSDKPKPVRKKKVVVPALMDNEQKIVEFLKQNGEVWQKQIKVATGFSKAKVSRLIRNLEERGVITKTIYGNTNKISLKQK